MAKCIFCDQDNSAGQSTCQLCSAPLPASDTEPLPEEIFRQQLVRLVNEGQRVQAVAAYRRRTGVDLTTAVEAIDTLEQDHQFSVSPQEADLEWEVIGYLERGEKIGAIKLYRDKTNLGLKEAKDFVEAIERRLGLGLDPPSKAGCLGMLFIACIVLAAAGRALAFPG